MMGPKARRRETAKWQALQEALEAARIRRKELESKGHGRHGGNSVGGAVGSSASSSSVVAALGDDAACHGDDHDVAAAGKPPLLGLPTIPLSSTTHDSRLDLDIEDWMAMISKPIPIREAKQIEGARVALQAEWDKLRRLRCWDDTTVAEYDDVVARAKSTNSIVHFGRIFELCHEKHSELPVDRRKYKGRVVFQGNNARDQDNKWAIFQEMQTTSVPLPVAKWRCPMPLERSPRVNSKGMKHG